MSKLNRFQKIILGVITFFVIIGILLKSISGSVTSNIGYDGITMLKYALIDYPAQTVKNLFADFANLWSVKEENDRLRYELSKNPSYKALYIDAKQKNAELEDALRIKTSDDKYERRWAEVILRDQATWNNEVTINKGSKEGIKVGMAVESTDGMVGKIKSVSSHTSVVKLLTSEDKLNSASIKILLDEKKSSLGVLQSYDVKRGCYIVLLFDDSSEIKKGMQVVTSGKGGGYPSGLLIGTVDSVQALSNQTGQTIYVRPIDDFQTFSVVSIIGEKGDE
ncbi:rod shape-determining protein MreC [[Clostridium] innocuum]|nr:rod shape-determining protein MreC [[Clostridium] innocuum]